MHCPFPITYGQRELLILEVRLYLDVDARRGVLAGRLVADARLVDLDADLDAAGVGQLLCSARQVVSRLDVYVDAAAATENPAVSEYVDYLLEDISLTTLVAEAGYVPLPPDRIAAPRARWAGREVVAGPPGAAGTATPGVEGVLA